jgi:hypothetical protein
VKKAKAMNPLSVAATLIITVIGLLSSGFARAGSNLVYLPELTGLYQPGTNIDAPLQPDTNPFVMATVKETFLSLNGATSGYVTFEMSGHMQEPVATNGSVILPIQGDVTKQISFYWEHMDQSGGFGQGGPLGWGMTYPYLQSSYDPLTNSFYVGAILFASNFHGNGAFSLSFYNYEVVGTGDGFLGISYSDRGSVFVESARFGLTNEMQLPSTPMAPVPEPETYAMMLAGLGLIGGIARRKKQQQTSA